MSRRIQTTALQATGGNVALDGYFDRVIKYVPSDIVGAWIAVTGIINSLDRTDPNKEVVHWTVFIVGVLLAVAWTWRQTTEPGKPTATLQITMSAIAFVVWVAALGGPF